MEIYNIKPGDRISSEITGADFFTVVCVYSDYSYSDVQEYGIAIPPTIKRIGNRTPFAAHQRSDKKELSQYEKENPGTKFLWIPDRHVDGIKSYLFSSKEWVSKEII